MTTPTEATTKAGLLAQIEQIERQLAALTAAAAQAFASTPITELEET